MVFTSEFRRDSDGDGLLDGEEVTVYGTDPANIDTDGDTYADEAELFFWRSDPLVFTIDLPRPSFPRG